MLNVAIPKVKGVKILPRASGKSEIRVLSRRRLLPGVVKAQFLHLRFSLYGGD